MHMNGTAIEPKTDFVEPRRNNYFYGQMMGVHQFEMQAHYYMAMHRRMNRLILGYGVACGLDVKKSDTKYPGIVVTSGFAIDKIGRDIIVPEQTMPLPVPGDLLPPPSAAPEGVRQEKGHKHEEQEIVVVHVVLCYHECKSDPAPILAGDCEGATSCAPGAIRERYRLELRKGKATPPSIADGRFPDVIEDGTLDYNRLVQWVTDGCPAYPDDDPCIPLANICLRVEDDGYCFDERDININTRPIVYTNDLLFDLLMAQLMDSPRYRRGK